MMHLRTPRLPKPAKLRVFLYLVTCLLPCVLVCGAGLETREDNRPSLASQRVAVLNTMARATRFVVEELGYRGGYVWSYLPDMSRRWGEIEARPSMIWIQPPGTPTVGELFLEAWEATGDERYYEAAKKAGDALIAGQLSCGGWNYVVDFAGEDSLREWYATVGRNAWRLEEFHHYFRNATFDDGTTVAAARFLLKLHRARNDPEIEKALERAIAFILESQHPSGLWPQRYPYQDVADAPATARYASYLTLNDDVSSGNIAFLSECYREFGGERLKNAIERGMDGFVRAQLPAPQAGWALQYTHDLQPAGARSYEPKAVATHTTARVIGLLLTFYKATGDRKFLAPVPSALEWLEACRLPEGAHPYATHPTFVEVGTGRHLYLHRDGSNAMNGRYFTDQNPEKLIGHYSSFRSIDTDALRKRYEAVRKQPAPAPGGAWRWEVLLAEEDTKRSERGARNDGPGRMNGLAERVEHIIKQLDEHGRWLSPLGTTSHPYIRDGTQERASGDFSSTFAGDETDTSPFGVDEPVMGISIKTYLRNMQELIAWLRANPGA